MNKTDIDILSEMIKISARVTLENHYDKKKVTLTEPQCPGTSVIIANIPEETVVIKVDAFKSPDSIFKGSHGECKRADYAIITCKDEKQVIIHIEMKRTKDDAKTITQQLSGSKCFLVYCHEIGKSFWNKRGFLQDFQQRFVSIGHISVPKKKTRLERPSGIHDSPDKMLKIDWPGKSIQFNLIAGISG